MTMIVALGFVAVLMASIVNLRASRADAERA